MQAHQLGICLAMLTLCCPSSVRNICDPDIPSRPLPPPPPGPPMKLRLSARSSLRCGAGQHPNESSGSCEPCPQGHFMTELMSRNGSYVTCERCQQANPDEVLVQNCTVTRDSTIICKQNKYRMQVSTTGERCHWECRPCSVCGVGVHIHNAYQIEPCGDFTDAVCCPVDWRCLDTTTATSGVELWTKGGQAMSTQSSLGAGDKIFASQTLMFLLVLYAIAINL